MKKHLLVSLFVVLFSSGWLTTAYGESKSGDGSGMGGTGLSEEEGEGGSGIGGTGVKEGGSGIGGTGMTEQMPERPEMPERIERPDIVDVIESKPDVDSVSGETPPIDELK